MPLLNHFTAWIEVDGGTLPEYKVEFDLDGRTVRCWIPSDEGKNFEVHWRDERRVSHSSGCVSVDGEIIQRLLLNPTKKLDGRRSCVGRFIDANHVSKMKFARMNLTDDDSLALDDETTLKELGFIKLEIRNGVIGEPASFVAPSYQLEPKPVHERMKKAAGHRVVPGEIAESAVAWSMFNYDDLPSTVFLFQYRPKDMLQALEIIPREARPALGPVPASSTTGLKREREEDDDDDDQEHNDALDDEDAERIRQLEAQLAALRNRNQRPRFNPPNGRSARQPKVERIEPVVPFRRGEVIDLT